MEGSSNISNLISSLEINTTRIDRACEKAMILFVHRHQVELISDLDTVWKEFLRCYPGDQNLGLDYDYSDLKLHYLCMDRSTNKWGLDEEVYLYFRYGAHVEEGFAEPEKDPENVNVNLDPTDKLLVTFHPKQNLNSGLSWDAFQLYTTAFQDSEEFPG